MIFDLIHAINKMEDKLADLTVNVENLGKSPSFRLSRQYMNEDEAARVLKCSPKHLGRMRLNNEIPHYKINRQIMYKASDLHDYLEMHYVQ